MSDTLASVTDGQLSTEQGGSGCVTKVTVQNAGATVSAQQAGATVVARPVSPVVAVRSSSARVVNNGAQRQVVALRDVVRTVVSGGVGVQGPPGLDGGSGGSTLLSSYESNHPGPLTRGTPVAKFGGKLYRATCAAPYNEVVGLVYDDQILQGQVGRVQSGGPLVLTIPEWEAATGIPGGLAAEQTYYLTPTGGMTPFKPSSSGEFIAPVGYAVSTTEFLIELGSQIRL
jgi:hypothetical protein